MKFNFSIKKIVKKFSADSPLPVSIVRNKDELSDEKLKESEIRYRRLFETAKDGILILDFETGNITDANPFIVKIIDFPLEEILGKRLWEIGLFSNMEESELAFSELKKNGYIRFEDMPIQRRNGKITEVEFISNVYLENNTKVIQCNIRDITDRKNAEKALKESEQTLKKQNIDYLKLNKEYLELNEELTESLNRIKNVNKELIIAKAKAEESDKLKSTFLANISHEIRTPMNAIMGFSGFLSEPGLSHEKLEDYVQIINASSQQLLSVISDIIDIAKIEAGQITIDSEFVDINKLMNELFMTYKKLVELKKIDLRYSGDCPNDLIQVKTDGNRVRQVMCNLLNNAIKFTKEGNIEFGYKILENFIEFYVKDTGIGILPEHHEIIFQRFRKAAPEGQVYGGNGLGLSISKALVQKLGGIITVDSKLGTGSTFNFVIPYTKEKEKNVSSVLTEKNHKVINWNNKTVLIVEDEIYNHAYIEELLSATNVNMVHAWDGKEAVEQVTKQADISLVLMDIKMPVMDGWEATRLIKEIRPELPVIAQTAYALAEDKTKALQVGFDSYISKPIIKEPFLELIGGYLN